MAQASAGKGKSQEARRLFEEGIELAKDQQWAEALWAFRKSRNLVQRPSTSYNIANALYRLDRPAEGLAELDKYDEMSGVIGNAAAEKRSAKLRNLLEGVVAEARLAITPADAVVYVDGRRTKGTGGERRIRLNAGPHSIRVTREGYEPITKRVEATRGGRDAYAIALRPTTPPAAAGGVGLPAPTEGASSADPITVGSASNAGSEDDRKPFVKRAGFWVMIGVIAAAGIGAGVAVAVTRKNDSPSCGTTGTCATAQGLTVGSF